MSAPTKVTQMPPPRPRPKVVPAANDEAPSITLTSDSLHDLASPVNQIGSMVDLIVRKYDRNLDAEAKTLFGFLQTSTDRLRKLIAGLRAYEQAVAVPASHTRADLNTLLAGALAMLQHSIAQQGAQVTYDPLPHLDCDPAQITYVFTALVENALKFRSEKQPQIHIGVSTERKFWILSFSDNGVGIDPRFRERIFGAFKRIHNDEFPGTGIGLAISKCLVERHGGRIWVESELGEGATFFVALPRPNERGSKPRSPKSVPENEAVA